MSFFPAVPGVADITNRAWHVFDPMVDTHCVRDEEDLPYILLIELGLG